MSHPPPLKDNRPAAGLKGTADASAPLDPVAWGRLRPLSAADGLQTVLPSYTKILTLPAQGLQLLIHDGGSGLCAALRTVHFAVPTQRCLFHKLRNIAQAIQLPEGLTRHQRSRQRKAILKHFREIWLAQRYATALRRYLKVVRLLRDSQPNAVATLRRDFRHTLAFYPLADTVDRRFLRTTSQLERFNRSLRTQFRKANTFHSQQGLCAVVAQQIARFNA